jgi:polyphosphate glucokinase
VVLLVTLGTGIGVAMISDGRLVANSELGHLELDGVDAETYAAASARERNGHSWEEWGAHADHYLKHLEGLVWPKLFVLGGGITKNPEKWLQYLHPRTPIVLAQHINNAGIVGAADATRQDSGASHVTGG